jgi:predicted RNase H-like HicB family nuclease
MKFTAIIEKTEDGWYVGQVEEMPAAISQGRTITELKENLLDALKLLMQVNRIDLLSRNAIELKKIIQLEFKPKITPP